MLPGQNTRPPWADEVFTDDETYWVPIIDHTTAMDALALIASLVGPYDAGVECVEITGRVEPYGDEWRFTPDSDGDVEVWEVTPS